MNRQILLTNICADNKGHKCVARIALAAYKKINAIERQIIQRIFLLKANIMNISFSVSFNA